MPFNTVSELPDSTKGLPAHGKEIYMKAFNSAFDQLKGDDGQEGKAHAIAWAAVQKVFHKVDDKWVAKEARNMNLSDDNKRNLLQGALAEKYGLTQESPIPKKLVMEEVFGDHVIYSVDGQYYKAAYVLEDDHAKFGDPEKVSGTKIYRTIEALQSVYADIIQEAGRRNASLDSGRIKKILQLCQELLSSDEEAPEKKIKKVIGEAEAVKKWLNGLTLIKVEEGFNYPVSAYAHTPDLESPDTWALRLREGEKVTKTQLDRAAATLSPGGQNRQLLTTLSDEALSGIKRKIREGYRALNIDDIPKWVSEVETREEVNIYAPLIEAKFDKGRAAVIIIKPGFNATKDRYYPAEMLKRDFGIFEGQKMYADHPTEEEDKARPERSIRDWVATLKDVSVDESGVVTGIAEIVEPWLMQKLASLRDKKMLSEMGISINAIGSATKAKIDGIDTLVIEELTGARSVDFVTEPGAGGVVTFFESDRRRDVDLVDLSILREKRPDLIKAIEADVRAKLTKEVKSVMESEAKIKELEGNNETLTTENETLKTKIAEGEKEKAKAVAQAAIKEAVDATELPDASKAVLIERFKNAESDDGIKEAIDAEIAYVAKLSEAGKVKGLGPSTTDTEKDVKALRESLKKTGMADAEIDTFVAGR